MAMCRQSSPTKRAKIRPARLGSDGSFTYDWLPRPASWPAAGRLLAERNATGINEYLYLLSLRHPEAIRCASHGPCHSSSCGHPKPAPCMPLERLSSTVHV